MKRTALLNAIGFSLIVGAMAVSVYQVFSRQIVESDPEVTTIRFAHTLLDVGLRETFEVLADDYESIQAARGRKVRIKQIAIPSRTYPQWIRTQIIGGTAPEIVWNNPGTFDDELTTRSLVPLGPFIERVNPYNEGTVLEGMPWRDTFFDGLDFAGFNWTFAEHFGIPLSAVTVRFFANRRMVEAILSLPENAALADVLGPDLAPQTFEAFMALCRATEAFGKKTGASIVPIAGSDYNGAQLMDRLVGSQTQQLMIEMNTRGDYRQDAPGFFLDLVAGRATYGRPEFRSAFELQRKVGQFMPSGFLQMRREDATFYFTQERALMIASTSWDAPSFRALIGDRFDLVIFKIPMPSPSNPDFGAFVLGQLTEADVIPSGTLAFLNSHPEPRFEQAVDFMMYLTSLRANETFSRMSGWLPAVIEARAAPVAKPFVPELEGYPRGPLPHFNETELKRVFDTAAYGLYSKSRTIDEYIEEVDQKSREIIPAMLQKNLRISRNNQRQQDTLMAAQLWIGRNLPEKAADAARKFDILVDSSNGNEHMEAFRRMRLKAAGIGGQGEGGD